ncbi:MAG: putative motility protein, partial [Candidatus Weimeria sp.]
MDIASLSMGLSQNKLLSQVGTAVLSNTLDNSQDMAA